MPIQPIRRSMPCIEASDRVQLYALRLVANGVKPRPNGYLDLDELSEVLQITLPDGEDAFRIRTFRKEVLARLQGLEASCTWQDESSVVTRNAGRIQGALALTDLETELLVFAAFLHDEPLLDRVSDAVGDLRPSAVMRLLAKVLGRPEEELREALNQRRTLARTGMLRWSLRSENSLKGALESLSDDFLSALACSDAEPLDLVRGVISKAGPADLSLADFPHLQSQLSLAKAHLRNAVQGHHPGVNLLLYGPPGTGKSQLCRALAASLDLELYEVVASDSEGDPMSGEQRLRAYAAAQALLTKQDGLVVFDEVQDIFGHNLRDWQGRHPLDGRKAWLNAQLEGNTVPALWVSNTVDAIDPAFIRRFDMVIEVPVPPRSQRERIVTRAWGGDLSTGALSRLIECETLAPAVVHRARRVAQSIGDQTGASPEQAALDLLHGTLRAQGHMGLPPAMPQHLRSYDPRFINAEVDLMGLADGIAGAPGARLCLYGPPGTGKSEWARWLSRRLERPLLVQQASQLISKWVGESEKNLAQAFDRVLAPTEI